MAYVQTAEIELASKNYIELQDTTDGSTTYDEGEVIENNFCICFPLSDVAISTKYAAVIEADKVSALKKAEAIDAGQAVYWDNATSTMTAIDSSAGLPLLGYALEDATAASCVIIMSFDGKGVRF